MKDVGQRIAEVAGLKHALPYLRLFQGKLFVVKLSGAALADAASLERFLVQLEILHRLGIRLVVVHGGGPQTTELATRLGLPTVQIDGRRVTDAPTLEAAIAATAGSASTAFTAASRRAGLPAVGLSGVAAGWIDATRRPPVAVDDSGASVNFGFVGDVRRVEPRLLQTLLDAGYVPAVSPLASDAEGTVLNVNADTIAAETAVALGAAKLLFAVATPGLLERVDDPGSLVTLTDLDGVAKLERAGAIAGGMLPKVRAVARALEGGVPRVHLIPFAAADALLAEVFTNEGIGTLVVRSLAELLPEPEAVSA
jgi:acetylglutamate kinase